MEVQLSVYVIILCSEAALRAGFQCVCPGSWKALPVTQPPAPAFGHTTALALSSRKAGFTSHEDNAFRLVQPSLSHICVKSLEKLHLWCSDGDSLFSYTSETFCRKRNSRKITDQLGWDRFMFPR